MNARHLSHDNMISSLKNQLKEFSNSKNKPQNQNGGKGKKIKICTGPRGGHYYWKNGRKVYVQLRLADATAFALASDNRSEYIDMNPAMHGMCTKIECIKGDQASVSNK